MITVYLCSVLLQIISFTIPRNNSYHYSYMSRTAWGFRFILTLNVLLLLKPCVCQCEIRNYLLTYLLYL